MNLAECIKARQARGLDGYGDYNKDPSTWPKYTYDGNQNGPTGFFTPFYKQGPWMIALDKFGCATDLNTTIQNESWQEYTEPKKPLTLECEAWWSGHLNGSVYPTDRKTMLTGDGVLMRKLEPFIGKRTKMVITEILEDA